MLSFLYVDRVTDQNATRWQKMFSESEHILKAFFPISTLDHINGTHTHMSRNRHSTADGNFCALITLFVCFLSSPKTNWKFSEGEWKKEELISSTLLSFNFGSQQNDPLNKESCFFLQKYKYWFNACIRPNWMAVTMMENIFQHVTYLRFGSRSRKWMQ